MKVVTPTMKRAVVTGGAGFIGSHLVEELLLRGYTVRVVDDVSTGSAENLKGVADRIEFIPASILDLGALARVFSGANVVFHQAAVPSVPKSVRDPLTSHEANATGTLQVLLAARDTGVQRVVYAASSSYYGDTPVLPQVEDLPPNPLSPYAAQKYLGEVYAKQFYSLFGLETVSLRYFNIYGPRQDPNSEYSAVIPKFIKLMKAGERPTIYGDGSASRSFTYVSDAVAANILAAEKEGIAGEVFNVGGLERTNLRELVATINTVLGTSIEPHFAPSRPGDIPHSFADISKAKKILGYVPRHTLIEGLTQTQELL